jgi:hypothetical protein
MNLSSEFLNERPGWVANYTRKLAAQAFEVMRAGDQLAFEALTITSEMNANAVKHGGQLSEFDLVHFPASDDTPETAYMVAVNPTKDKTATPGTDRRGKLAAKGSNQTAESGRGLLMTDAYTNHNWGQRNVVDLEGKREIVTFAVLTNEEEPTMERHDQAA